MTKSRLSRLMDTRPLPGSRYRVGWATISITAAIVAVYVLEMVVAAENGVLWELVWHGEVATKWLNIFRIAPLWTDYPILLFPHTFAHGAFLTHFLVNTAIIALCAPSLEGRIGSGWTWGVFVAVGALSGALQSSLLDSVAWGASGPGLTFLALWLVLDARPTARRAWSWLDRFPSIKESPFLATWVDWGQDDRTWTWGSWLLVVLLAGVSIVKLGSGDGTGHAAHLTGLAVGAMFALVLPRGSRDTPGPSGAVDGG